MKEVHCQTSMMMTAAKAGPDLLSHGTPGMPNQLSTSLSGPRVS